MNGEVEERQEISAEAVAALLVPLQELIAAEAARLAEARRVAGQAEQEAAQVQAEVHVLRREREALVAATAVQRRQAQLARTAAESAEEARAAAQAELDALRQELAQVQAAVAEARGVMQTLQQQRDVEEATTRAVVHTLRQQQDAAEQAMRRADAEADAARKQKNLALAEAAEARSQREQLQEAVAVAQDAAVAARLDADLARAEAGEAAQAAAAARAEHERLVQACNDAGRAAEVARGDLAALQDAHAALEARCSGLEEREQHLRSLPEPVASLLGSMPERLRERATDSLFVRLPAVDREALEQAARLQRGKVQELVRDALRAYLGPEVYQGAVGALRGGPAEAPEG